MPEEGLWVQVFPATRGYEGASWITYIATTLVTLGALPSLLWGSGYNLYFHVYRDGNFLHEYRYETDTWTLAGLIFLPFSWITWVASNDNDLFAEVVERFMREASADQAFEAWPFPQPNAEFTRTEPRSSFCIADADCDEQRVCVVGECVSSAADPLQIAPPRGGSL